MARLGAEHVSDHVLLAIVLRSGVQGTNVADLARDLLNRYGSLTDLARTTSEELASIRGMGKVKAQVLKATLELAKRLTEESIPDTYTLRSPLDVALLLREKTRTLEKEVFWALLLDAKNCLKVPPQTITKGLLDASLVHPREVFRAAIKSSSAALILAHNHPSGDSTPSAEDLRITKQLVEAGRIVDIKVLDHVIIGARSSEKGDGFLSMREAGIIDFA
jgi:DNA repair protein RadC